jgi:hypothetical protein
MAEAVRPQVDEGRWPYVAPDESVSVMTSEGKVAERRAGGRCLIGQLAAAYDELHAKYTAAVLTDAGERAREAEAAEATISLRAEGYPGACQTIPVWTRCNSANSAPGKAAP